MRAFVPLGVGLLLLAQSGIPCSCGDDSSVAEAFSKSSLVVLATVTRIEERDSWWHRLEYLLGFGPRKGDPGQIYDSFGHRVTLSVEKAWKGSQASAKTTILTGKGTGDCGFLFVVGERYLVYASPSSVGIPFTIICHRTRLAADAQLDLQTLDSIVTSGKDAA